MQVSSNVMLNKAYDSYRSNNISCQVKSTTKQAQNGRPLLKAMKSILSTCEKQNRSIFSPAHGGSRTLILLNGSIFQDAFLFYA